TPPAATSVLLRVQFVDHHRVDLVERVTAVEPIAERLLAQHLIQVEEYSMIMDARSHQEKMRLLYHYLDHRGNAAKSAFYTILREVEPHLIQDLGKGKHPIRFQCSSGGVFECSLTGLRFSMKSSGELEYSIVNWDTNLLTPTGLQPAGPLFSIDCPQESLRELGLPHCEILSVDPAVQFVDQHRAELVQRVTQVEPMADALITERLMQEEEYRKITTAGISQEKMRRLYVFLNSVGDTAKQAFYRILKERQPLLVQELEGQGSRLDS
ncbi:hypothetical protein JZ751_013321, partial [Albula glossodonta]